MCHITKEKNLSKNSTKTATCNLVPDPFFCLQGIRHNIYWEMKFMKEATYIRHAAAKSLKFVQISMQPSTDSFLQRIL